MRRQILVGIAGRMAFWLVVLGLVPGSAIPSVAQRRPAKPPAASKALLWEDVTPAAGIDFHLTCGTAEKLYVMDALCGGVAVLDFDNDGWMDLFLVNGSTLDGVRRGKHPKSKLYRNNRNGTFTDVSGSSGLVLAGWGMGAATGDYDNDGWTDLYVTFLSGGRLFRNLGDGTFGDVTDSAGVGNGGRWGTSAAFGDFDHDGHLDLYVANYVELDLENLPAFGSSPLCQYRGIPVSCGPRGLKGSRDRLYRNRGDGTFEDVSERLGIDPRGYYGLGVVWGDVNNDGCQDIYVADDSSPSLLYLGDCKGGLREVGVESGVAFSDDGREQAGMGVDLADYDHDGALDLVKTNFSDDTNNLYRNNGKGEFTDWNGPAGFGPVSVPLLGFGVRFFDADNDGWKDLFVANGHVNPQVDAHTFGVTYAQRNLLFRNLGDGRFDEVGLKAGAAMKVEKVSRGAAVADFDNDGRLDLVVTSLDASPVLLRNAASASGHFIRIRTIGRRSNRDGLGARITVSAGGLVQMDEVRTGSSYLSASDRRMHFGLAKATRVERIEVRWSSGAVDVISDQVADQDLVVIEGEGAASSEVRRAVPNTRHPATPAN